MRKSRVETAETRKKILEVASKAFRKQGIEATGVQQIMATAGLSHGGFYRHFDSKEQLVAEAIACSPKNFVTDSEAAAEKGGQAMRKVFTEYVTPGYRDNVEVSCPLASNGSELVRANGSVRHVATDAFQRIINAAAPFMGAKNEEEAIDASISVLTNMIGALTMARMVDDPALSDRILSIAKKRVADTFQDTKLV